MTPTPEPYKTDWHKIARQGTLIAKIVVYCCLLGMLIYWTGKICPMPYSIFCIGIEIAILTSSCLASIRRHNVKPFKQYDNPGLKSKDPQLIHLLSLLTFRAKEYNQNADYYLTGFKIFKYTTMILSAISTILLGLNLTSTLNYLGVDAKFVTLYPDIAKNLAFLIGAVVTVYTGIVTFWNIERYWLQNRSVGNKLISLREEIENMG